MRGIRCFEHNHGVGAQWDALTVGKEERLVVVKDLIQVFNPNGIDLTLEHDPSAFVRSHLKDWWEHAISPNILLHVEMAVELAASVLVSLDSNDFGAGSLGCSISHSSIGSHVWTKDHDTVSDSLNFNEGLSVAQLSLSRLRESILSHKLLPLEQVSFGESCVEKSQSVSNHLRFISVFGSSQNSTNCHCD